MTGHAGNTESILGRTFTLGECLGWWGITLMMAILGAHFYRSGEYGLTLCVLGCLGFHASSIAWKRYAAALLLYLGAFEWLHTGYQLAQMRLAMGAPWIRGTAIILAVAFVTAVAAKYAFDKARTLDVAEGGNASDKKALFQALVAACTFLLLFLVQQSAPLPLLILERFFPLFGAVQMFLAAWYAGFIAGKLIDPRQSKVWRRRAWLLFSLCFFGQLALGLAGIPEFLMTGRLHLPVPAFIAFAPVYRGAPGMMPFIALAVILLTGTAWCSLLCYFGSFDCAAAGRKAVKPLSPRVRVLFGYSRAVILAGGCLIAFLLRQSGASVFTALGFSLAFIVVSVAIIGLVSRRYSAMVHCSALCPFGFAVSVLGRLSPWRVKVDTSRCDNCGACEKVCKTHSVTPLSRMNGTTLYTCTMCRDCTSVCPKGALQVKAPFLSSPASAMLFVGMISVLHVAFLMLARV